MQTSHLIEIIYAKAVHWILGCKMPYAMRKLPHKNLYRVYNAKTKKIHAKATTKKRAMAQIRLLRMREK